jgi:cytosine/uracil/thiamine/allantoin permease
MEHRLSARRCWPGMFYLKGKTFYTFDADTSQTWQQSFISACLGSFLAAIVVVLMARPGAKYHIGL